MADETCYKYKYFLSYFRQYFVVVYMFKLFPVIRIPMWLWSWIGVIVIIKITNIVLGYISKKQFISLHTIMNKVTGLLLFLLPLTISFMELKYTAIAVCSVATFSAIQEGFYSSRAL